MPRRKKYMRFAGSTGRRGDAEDLVLLIDCSGSMEATDYPPSRLEAAIEAGCALVSVKAQHYPHDRIALVSFSSKGQIEHQLAEAGASARSIKRALRNLSSGTSTNITGALACAETVFNGGTRSGSGSPSFIGQLKRFLYEPEAPAAEKQSPPRSRRVLLLSDGANNHGSKSQLFAAAKRMKQSGIVIAGVGIGGSPSKVNEDAMKHIVSRDADTRQPLYCFIGDGDSASLIREFKRQAHHIQRVRED